MTVERPAWVVPALGLGVYADALTEEKLVVLKRKSLLHVARSNGGVRDFGAGSFGQGLLPERLPQFPQGVEKTHDGFVFDIVAWHRGESFKIDEKELRRMVDEHHDAVFSYHYAAQESGELFRLPQRERVDAPLEPAGLERRLAGLRIPFGIDHLTPR